MYIFHIMFYIHHLVWNLIIVSWNKLWWSHLAISSSYSPLLMIKVVKTLDENEDLHEVMCLLFEILRNAWLLVYERIRIFFHSIIYLQPSQSNSTNIAKLAATHVLIMPFCALWPCSYKAKNFPIHFRFRKKIVLQIYKCFSSQ